MVKNARDMAQAEAGHLREELEVWVVPFPSCILPVLAYESCSLRSSLMPLVFVSVGVREEVRRLTE